MALSGRLNAIVPDAAIEGFDSVRTVRRAKFSRNILLNAQWSSTRTGIANEDILFSEGPVVALWSHTFSAGASTGQGVIRSITINSTLVEGLEVPEGYGERFVLLLLNAGTSEFDYAVTGLVTPPSGTTAGVTNITVRVNDRGGVYRVLFYAVPFLAFDGSEGGATRFSYLGTDEGTVVVDLLTGESVGTPVSFGRSVYYGVRESNPPA